MKICVSVCVKKKLKRNKFTYLILEWNSVTSSGIDNHWLVFGLMPDKDLPFGPVLYSNKAGVTFCVINWFWQWQKAWTWKSENKIWITNFQRRLSNCFYHFTVIFKHNFSAMFCSYHCVRKKFLVKNIALLYLGFFGGRVSENILELCYFLQRCYFLNG